EFAGAKQFVLTDATHPHYFVCRRFFFQAEDGIRDLTVTGVQTCALPIFQRMSRATIAEHRRLPFVARLILWTFARPASLTIAMRSEERRVGKECRRRVWAVLLKK